MVFLLTDVFLLLTQVLLWIVVGLVVWFVLLKTLPREFLSLLVLLLILVVLVLSFIKGPPVDGGVIEIIWRVISFPFTPLGLGLVLLIVLLSGRKLGKLAKRAINVALVLLAICSLPIVSYHLAQELEMEAVELIRPPTALISGARRVIVLLGQDTTHPQLRPAKDGPPSPVPKAERAISQDAYQTLTRLPTQLTERGDRLFYAHQLYLEETRAGTDPLIVVSAGTRPERKQKEGEKKEDISEAKDIQLFLTQSMGIPEDKIRLDHDSFSIHDSAENVKKLLEDQKINFGNQLLLIGSAMNMNRAFLTFGKTFDESTIYARPTDFYSLPPAGRLAKVAKGRDIVEQKIQVTDVLPHADAFALSSRAIEEYINALFYFLRGWIKPFTPAR